SVNLEKLVYPFVECTLVPADAKSGARAIESYPWVDLHNGDITLFDPVILEEQGIKSVVLHSDENAPIDETDTTATIRVKRLHRTFGQFLLKESASTPVGLNVVGTRIIVSVGAIPQISALGGKLERRDSLWAMMQLGRPYECPDGYFDLVTENC